MIRSLRAQLTAWYVGVLALVLISLAAASYLAAESMIYRRLNTSLHSTLRDTERALAQQSKKDSSGSAAASSAFEGLNYPNRTIWLLSQAREVLATKPAAAGPVLRFPAELFTTDDQTHYYSLQESRPDADDSCRGVFQNFRPLPAGETYVLVVAQSDETVSDQLHLLQDLALVIVPIALVLAGSGGWFLARRSLAPIAFIERTVRQITATNLEGRVHIKNPDDEIGRLSAEFNRLIDRLAAALTQQRQFMADASHELRTPLSVVRTAAEVTLGKEGRTEGEYRDALSIVKHQARRLTHLVDGMFALARADMGHQAMHAGDFYVDEIVNEAVHAANVLAARKGQKIEVDLEEGDFPFHGDESLVRQMILVLLDNALKYTGEGGSVKVRVEKRETEYAIAVTDSGPGIALEDQPHVFDRFFRSDRARTASANGSGGTGLGLPIARSIAELHRGQVTLVHSDASGSTFVILLPFTSTGAEAPTFSPNPQ